MFALDYFWKNGAPALINHRKGPLAEGISFKLISDSYQKHLTLEMYRDGAYDHTIYDSLILDFRKLKPVDQTGWRQEIAARGKDEHKVLIRDLDDRVIHIECHTFENSICRKCLIYSCHGWLAAYHKLFYVTLGDSFNGVILFDTHHKPVVIKKYDVDGSNDFTTLKSETWDMKHAAIDHQ